jgi:arsenite transporter
MLTGIALGKFAPAFVGVLGALEFGTGSQINLPTAVFIGLRIIPMMMKVDFTAIQAVGKKPQRSAGHTVVNWMVKPFSMALISWLFFRHTFSQWISPTHASQYVAGTIILGAAPCTAMVFWSYLIDRDPAYTLAQVSLHDLIMLFLFALTVRFLVSGATSLSVPFRVLFCPCHLHRDWRGRGRNFARPIAPRRGKDWFENVLPPRIFTCHDSRAAGNAGPYLRVPGGEPHW